MDVIYVANKYTFSKTFFSKKLMKDIILLIVVIILLSVIFFFNTKTLEKFVPNERPIVPAPESYPVLNNANDVSQLYNLQRIYPVGDISYYDVGRFPNVVLPGDVVGCGSRREPCYGGSQQIVNNILPPLELSNSNVAPTTGTIGPNPPFQEVGYLYKIMAPYEENAYKPLYLKKINPDARYPVYKYFTLNTNNERQDVIIPNKLRELGTNDQVKIKGEKYFYRVTVNQSNFPSYPRITSNL